MFEYYRLMEVGFILVLFLLVYFFIEDYGDIFDEPIPNDDCEHRDSGRGVCVHCGEFLTEHAYIYRDWR
jgi:hypothetical protein